MNKGANKIKGVIFACLGDCIVWNVLKIFLKYFIWKLENSDLSKKNVVIFYYVNIYFEYLPQNMSCFKIFINK
jgi:hypothetical protein